MSFKHNFSIVVNFQKVNQGLMYYLTPLRTPAKSFTDQLGTKLRIKEKPSIEDGPNYKELLSWIVRLIIVDPYLVLHNPNKLDHETQMSIFELFNGLVSLVHDSSMLDVAHSAMQALLVLHQKENIEKWNPESPINTFWSISSQVCLVTQNHFARNFPILPTHAAHFKNRAFSIFPILSLQFVMSQAFKILK